MKIQLSDHFTYGKLFKFVISSVIMMIFSSLYSVVDGLFIANIVGSNALASINIIYPLIMIIASFGFMLGTGGGAIISKTLGQNDNERANKYFTMFVYSIVIFGVVVSTLCIIFTKQIAYLFGANELLIKDCVIYGRILLIGVTPFMLQNAFQTFLIIAEKPHLGLALNLICGTTNIVLDFVFVYVLKMGIAGAGLATITGYLIGGIVPLIYFIVNKKVNLKFTKFKFYHRVFLNSCINGSSEMLTNISMSIITMLYNLQMMKLIGEDGVASITVIMYVNFVFVSSFLGFSIGTAPIIGYNYGADNDFELKNMFSKSIKIISVTSVVMFILSEVLAETLVGLFVKDALFDMTLHGFRLYSISFLLCGINIYASSFFTALNNGLLSAIISVLRSFLLQAIMILLLPKFLDLNGIWLSVVFSELITSVVSITLLIKNKHKYNYA
ncbi:MAG: MATE family efflux transporter [Ruminococcus sp.]|nr:MATE family efflux transporter [Ruminococcus sp.]